MAPQRDPDDEGESADPGDGNHGREPDPSDPDRVETTPKCEAEDDDRPDDGGRRDQRNQEAGPPGCSGESLPKR